MTKEERVNRRVGEVRSEGLPVLIRFYKANDLDFGVSMIGAGHNSP